MREVEYFRWWMPAWRARGREYLTAYKMDAETARQRGALRPDPASREVRLEPETPEEERRRREASDTSRSGAARWWAPAQPQLPPLLDLPVRQVRWLDDRRRPPATTAPG